MSALKKRSPKGDPATDEAIHGALTRAILHGELKAGTKLAEHPLAQIFGVSRERVRKVLQRLAAERRLEIIPNRGARVPQPSVEDVKAIYEAHRVLEAGVLMQLEQLPHEEILDRLQAHLAEERSAAERGDRAASVRLSGAFHIHLVDSLGNAELSRFLRDLLSRSSVMVSVYEPAGESICAVEEHGAIVDALRAHDVPRAIELSRRHFVHVEQRLRLEIKSEATPDLAAVFGRSGRARKPRPRAARAS